jgi:DNA-binding CsgD family transcriptional regulator
MLAEAASACFIAGNAAEMQRVAERANATLPHDAKDGARFMTLTALGMARILGGNAAAGAQALREAVALAEASPEVRDDLQLLPWLGLGPNFLRESGGHRSLIDDALKIARDRAAVGALPLVLALVARDEATSDRWPVAEATYREAIDLARESDQRSDLAFGVAGLAWLEGCRGHDQDCRALAAEAIELGVELGTRLFEVWASAALGELELGAGDASQAAQHFQRQNLLLDELGITDVDLSPAAELVDAYMRLGQTDDAQRLTAELLAAAEAKRQPWSLARAMRCAGLIAGEDAFASHFERALELHAQTPDEFETARTRLAYGARLRRSRNRVLAREQLRKAVNSFERLGARAWAERGSAELAATGETVRRRDPSTLDDLTPQELQIGLLLAAGKTTREAAAALFLSPKTIEYHLRHVYQKLGIHSRAELAQALGEERQVTDRREAIALG